nr:MepB family protein [Lactococcus paracarnosus]
MFLNLKGALKGQFVFPKSILINQGVLRREHVKGKMAMRVYPTWLDHLNLTASKTQKWQGDYFIDLSSEVDHNRVAQLYFT